MGRLFHTTPIQIERGEMTVQKIVFEIYTMFLDESSNASY